MATERKWLQVLPKALTQNGDAEGTITVLDTLGFHTKQKVNVFSNTIQSTQYEIKRIIGPHIVLVGPPGTNIDSRSDTSQFLVVDNAQIRAFEQIIPTIKLDDIVNAVYNREPSTSIRTTNVDPYGNEYTAENPLPVAIEGAISIGQVEVKGTNGNIIEPNPDGSLNVIVENSGGGLAPTKFDEVDIIRDGEGDATQYQFYLNAVSQGVINVTYDANKNPSKYKKA